MNFDVWIYFSIIFISIRDIIIVRNIDYPYRLRVTVGLKINLSGSVTAQKLPSPRKKLRNSEPTGKFVLQFLTECSFNNPISVNQVGFNSLFKKRARDFMVILRVQVFFNILITVYLYTVLRVI